MKFLVDNQLPAACAGRIVPGDRVNIERILAAVVSAPEKS